MRNVIPSHISVFPSKLKGTILAKIGIPIASVSKVQEKKFGLCMYIVSFGDKTTKENLLYR